METNGPAVRKRLKELSRRIVRNAEQGPRRIALAALSQVVIATPVLSGRARGNWQVTSGNPVDQETGRDDKSGGATIAAGQAAIAAHQPGAGIILQNNVPYIVVLNTGTSKQAPEMFIERGIRAGIDEAARIKLSAP